MSPTKSDAPHPRAADRPALPAMHGPSLPTPRATPAQRSGAAGSPGEPRAAVVWTLRGTRERPPNRPLEPRAREPPIVIARQKSSGVRDNRSHRLHRLRSKGTRRGRGPRGAHVRECRVFFVATCSAGGAATRPPTVNTTGVCPECGGGRPPATAGSRGSTIARVVGGLDWRNDGKKGFAKERLKIRQADNVWKSEARRAKRRRRVNEQ